MTMGFSTHSNHFAPSSLLSHAICYIAVGPIELLSSDDEEFSTNSTWTVSHSRIGWYSKISYLKLLCTGSFKAF